jgi:MtN3 and saliva related transmembrane protein
MISATTIIGFLAAVLTTGCNIPQLYKVWKTRSTKDLSLRMLVALSAGSGLWLAYGVLDSDVAIIGANLATLLTVLPILYFKATE